MTDDEKLPQDQDNKMTFQTRDDCAKQSPYPDRRCQGDELGPNTEIGSKLRALYSSIQDETIPDRFLDLLEKLDQIEFKSRADPRN